MSALPHTLSRGALALFAVMSGLLSIVLLADLNGGHVQDLSLSHPGIDKLAHFGLHFLLVVALYAIVRRHWPRPRAGRILVTVTGVSVLFGLLDEGHQYFIGGRDFDLFDVAANLCGAASGAALLALLRNKRSFYRLLATAIPLLSFAAVLTHAQTQTQHFNSGLLLIRTGQYAAAREELLRAVAEGHTSPGLYNELAWLELEHLDLDPAPALSYTTRAVTNEPGNADYLDTHGWALYRNGRYREALDALLKAYALAPDTFYIHYHLGATYSALGREADAVKQLELQLQTSTDTRFGAKARALLQTLGHKTVAPH